MSATTTDAVQPDLAAVKQRQQQTWPAPTTPGGHANTSNPDIRSVFQDRVSWAP
jgi:hypothetical protein